MLSPSGYIATLAETFIVYMGHGCTVLVASCMVALCVLFTPCTFTSIYMYLTSIHASCQPTLMRPSATVMLHCHSHVHVPCLYHAVCHCHMAQLLSN